MRWYEVVCKADGTRHLARREDAGMVAVMTRRGLLARLISADEASRDYERGEVHRDQSTADKQYALAVSLALVTTRIRGARRYDAAA